MEITWDELKDQCLGDITGEKNVKILLSESGGLRGTYPTPPQKLGPLESKSFDL